MNTDIDLDVTPSPARAPMGRFRRIALITAAVVAGFSPVAILAVSTSNATPIEPASPDTTVVTPMIWPHDMSTPWPNQGAFCPPDAVSCTYPSPDSASWTNPDGSGGMVVIDRVFPGGSPDVVLTGAPLGQPNVVGSTSAP